jgi:hypothetical protein
MKKILLFLVMIAEICFASDYNNAIINSYVQKKFGVGCCLDMNYPKRNIQEDALSINSLGDFFVWQMVLLEIMWLVIL